MRDLVVLAADKQAEFAVRGILSRHQSLGIRHVIADFFVHPEHDPGCLLKSSAFLAPFRLGYQRALVVFDRDGCGRDTESREALEKHVEDSIVCDGWLPQNLGVIVLDPELEAWVWSDSPEVASCLGWKNKDAELREWMSREWNLNPNGKPAEPKEAVEAALKRAGKPRSSAIYQQLAQTVGLGRCVDPAFLKLRQKLIEWFPRV